LIPRVGGGVDLCAMVGRRRASLVAPDSPEVIFLILLFLLVSAIRPGNLYANATPVVMKK
jgi:hypothetical protein